MKGYSKIKGKTSFIPRSNSNKEFLFHDKDFDNISSKSNNKKTHLHEQEPNIVDDEDHQNNKKNDIFLGKSSKDGDGDYDHDDHSLKSEGGGERTKGVLWRNLSISSTTTPSYQKNNNKDDHKNNNNNNNNNNDSRLERQSSTRAIQDAVKRAFSKKRSSSVNSDRYCRIYDQPMNNGDDDYDNYVNNHDDGYNSQHDDNDDFGTNNGSFKTRSGNVINKYHQQNSNGKKHVGSKVVRACKRLFSR